MLLYTNQVYFRNGRHDLEKAVTIKIIKDDILYFVFSVHPINSTHSFNMNLVKITRPQLNKVEGIIYC
jgi:hypothetical protein